MNSATLGYPLGNSLHGSNSTIYADNALQQAGGTIGEVLPACDQRAFTIGAATAAGAQYYGASAAPAPAPASLDAKCMQLDSRGFAGIACTPGAAEQYGSYRTFGTPVMLKLAQAAGDVQPVQRPGGLSFVDFKRLQAFVDGRGAASGTVPSTSDPMSDTYRNDAPFVIPVASGGSGVTAAPVRPEQYLQTVDEALSTVCGGEMVNPRPFEPSSVTVAMNLMPVSEAAQSRASQVCRLNYIHDAYVRSRVQAFAASTF